MEKAHIAILLIWERTERAGRSPPCTMY